MKARKGKSTMLQTAKASRQNTIRLISRSPAANKRSGTAALSAGVHCEVTTISPEVALAMLDQSPGNRKVSQGTVAAYARDMKAKRWALTTEPICFDKNGKLLNGHHRLKACIEANTPFQSLISYGLDPTARDFMDQGRVRKASDVLAFAGHHNTLKLAACARLLMEIKTGFVIHRRKRTTAEITDLVKKHSGLSASIRASDKMIGVPHALVATIHYVGSRLLDDPTKADAFVAVLKSGIPAYTNDPAHLLRERLLRQRGEASALKRQDTINAAIHCFNLFRKKQPLTSFRWPKDVSFDDLNVKSI